MMMGAGRGTWWSGSLWRESMMLRRRLWVGSRGLWLDGLFCCSSGRWSGEDKTGECVCNLSVGGKIKLWASAVCIYTFRSPTTCTLHSILLLLTPIPPFNHPRPLFFSILLFLSSCDDTLIGIPNTTLYLLRLGGSMSSTIDPVLELELQHYGAWNTMFGICTKMDAGWC